MNPRRRSDGPLSLALGLMAVAVVACGDDPAPDNIILTGSAEWRDDPGSVADVGYRVWADVGWVSRLATCARIPEGLRATVNDIEGRLLGPGGECSFDVLFDAGPFTSPDPVTVRLFERDRLRGEATFEGLFRGMQATLSSPAGGEVRPGDDVVVAIPPGMAPPLLLYAKWYWLGTAPSVPPFYSSSVAKLSADASTLTAKVPDMNGLTGPVALTFMHGGEDPIDAASCTGFTSCGLYARYTVGPVALTVLAP